LTITVTGVSDESDATSAGIVIVIAACLVASFYPARRAAAVEPLVALRIE
jgi:ABC-type lipoprotein release transport system permease subunit